MLLYVCRCWRGLLEGALANLIELEALIEYDGIYDGI